MPFTKDDVAPTRDVTGVLVPLSDAEREAMAAEWNVEEIESAQRKRDEIREAKIQARAELLSRNLAIADLENKNEI